MITTNLPEIKKSNTSNAKNFPVDKDGFGASATRDINYETNLVHIRYNI